MPRKKPKEPQLLVRKKGDVAVVKTGLQRILQNPTKYLSMINQLVTDGQEIVTITYQFIRLYLLHCLKIGKEFPSLDWEKIIYFIRACGHNEETRGGKPKNMELQEELDAFYIENFAPLLSKDPFNLNHRGQITSYLAQQMETAIQNNTKTHYITRVRHYLNVVRPEGVNEEDWFLVKNSILANDLLICPEEWREWVAKQLAIVAPKVTAKVKLAYHCACNPDMYLKHTIQMAQEIEKKIEYFQRKAEGEVDTKQKSLLLKKTRLFQSFPLRSSFIPCYITLDAVIILDLIQDELPRGEKSLLVKKVTDNLGIIWSKLFRMDKHVMKMKGYTIHTLQTDGIAASICFTKDTKKKFHKAPIESDDAPYLEDLSEDTLLDLADRKLVAVDPGKKDLALMLHQSTDTDGNKIDHTLRYSAAQRRYESKQKHHQNILLKEKQEHGIISLETELSFFCSSTTSFEKFTAYLQAYYERSPQLEAFYQKRVWRKLRWQAFMLRRSSEDRFLNRMEETFGKPEEVLICYGDWSNPKQMKYIAPTMNKGLRKVVQKRFDVVLVDEFRTSKLCSYCDKELVNKRKEDGHKIHRLLQCNDCRSEKSGHEGKITRLHNRDVNACRNLLYLSKKWMKHQHRPSAFSRSSSAVG